MRHLLGTAALSLVLMWATAASADSITIQDVAGRDVKIDRPIGRLVLSEGRYIEALALVETGNPAKRVVGLAGGPGNADAHLMEQLNTRWPETRDIAVFGGRGPESVSAEQIIALKPDAALFGLADHGAKASNAELIAQLEKAGIPVVFIDFRSDPLKNTRRSVELIGALLGKHEKAAEFLAFYDARRQRIVDRIKGFRGERPKVFLQAHVGRMPCCVGMAEGMLGPMVAFAGGRNVSADVSPGPIGRHTMEFLIAQKIDILIGTASGTKKDFDAQKPMIVLGPGVDETTAHTSLKRAFAAPGYQTLPAWSSGRVHGLWHSFYDSPFNLYALETLAKWIHPNLFQDIDPDETLTELYAKFSPFERSGTYSISFEAR